jgi:hypothetical protein
MGKTDNIKRAKKLKETKRKREQDALFASGLGPAAQTLKQRNDEKGIITTINKGKVKYSEVLKTFVSPIIDELDDISIVRSKYMLGAFAWNAAILKSENDETFRLAKKEILDMTADVPEIEPLFDEMVNTKLEDFSEYTFIIADFEIKKMRGKDYELTVAITPVKAN